MENMLLHLLIYPMVYVNNRFAIGKNLIFYNLMKELFRPLTNVLGDVIFRIEIDITFI